MHPVTFVSIKTPDHVSRNTFSNHRADQDMRMVQWFCVFTVLFVK